MQIVTSAVQVTPGRKIVNVSCLEMRGVDEQPPIDWKQVVPQVNVAVVDTFVQDVPFALFGLCLGPFSFLRLLTVS